ncbi:eCIS core domain-containing protein [Streptomyces orinoci]|uniref:DUF4157 domain-containing protein n=2 Tax=Streptomyces orinoci TaxID=67339 RepID=A0ABV3K0P7_STRON|nr:DUF4157 domain-containing protein [Streptomyces orinoci]
MKKTRRAGTHTGGPTTDVPEHTTVRGDIPSSPLAGLLGLQRAAGNAATAGLLRGGGGGAARVWRPLRAPGQPLDSRVRAELEPRMNADFSDVRVHTGPAADEAAASVGARAFTAGSHIVFRHGQYAPDSRQGRQVLAHELTHVLQQRAGAVAGVDRGDGIRVSEPTDRYERAAEAVARGVLTESPPLGGHCAPGAPASGGQLAVQRAGEETATGAQGGRLSVPTSARGIEWDWPGVGEQIIVKLPKRLLQQKHMTSIKESLLKEYLVSQTKSLLEGSLSVKIDSIRNKHLSKNCHIEVTLTRVGVEHVVGPEEVQHRVNYRQGRRTAEQRGTEMAVTAGIGATKNYLTGATGPAGISGNVLPSASGTYRTTNSTTREQNYERGEEVGHAKDGYKFRIFCDVSFTLTMPNQTMTPWKGPKKTELLKRNKVPIDFGLPPDLAKERLRDLGFSFEFAEYLVGSRRRLPPALRSPREAESEPGFDVLLNALLAENHVPDGLAKKLLENPSSVPEAMHEAFKARQRIPDELLSAIDKNVPVPQKLLSLCAEGRTIPPFLLKRVAAGQANNLLLDEELGEERSPAESEYARSYGQGLLNVLKTDEVPDQLIRAVLRGIKFSPTVFKALEGGAKIPRVVLDAIEEEKRVAEGFLSRLDMAYEAGLAPAALVAVAQPDAPDHVWDAMLCKEVDPRYWSAVRKHGDLPGQLVSAVVEGVAVEPAVLIAAEQGYFGSKSREQWETVLDAVDFRLELSPGVRQALRNAKEIPAAELEELRQRLRVARGEGEELSDYR